MKIKQSESKFGFVWFGLWSIYSFPGSVKPADLETKDLRSVKLI